MSIPVAVQRIRADICSRCPSPCEHQQNPAWHATACAVCPLTHEEYPQRWHSWGACDELASTPELRGLEEPKPPSLLKQIFSPCKVCGSKAASRVDSKV